MVAFLDIPCATCGWKYPGWHVCVLDFSTPEGLKRARHVEPHQLGAPSTLNGRSKVKRKPPSRAHQPDFGSDEDRANRSESSKKAWADKDTTERDKEIIRLYDVEKLSITRTAEEAHVDWRTARRILHLAAQDGTIELRVNLGGRPRQDAA